MKHSVGLQLWHLFKYTKLTEVGRQNGTLFVYFDLFFFNLGFLSRPFAIHRTTSGGYLFNYSLPLSPASRTL